MGIERMPASGSERGEKPHLVGVDMDEVTMDSLSQKDQEEVKKLMRKLATEKAAKASPDTDVEAAWDTANRLEKGSGGGIH